MHKTLEEQVQFLMQGTEYGDERLKAAMAKELQERLTEAHREGRPLKVYAGFDPTSSDLHIGHTVPMRKLKTFQDLGHDVTFVVGDFTSLVGDPSDTNKLRPALSPEEVRRNAQTYAEQAFQILDPERTHIRFNSEWLSELPFLEFMRMAQNFTLQQFLTRDNFRSRWDRGDAVYLHETFYAILQGYDAYTLKADVQVGGSDQLYNIVTASRKLMPLLGGRANIAIILDILPGTDGSQKMSKSAGNSIPLLAGAGEMYGKVMSIPDHAMALYFRLVTRLDPGQISALEAQMASGALHPRDAKMRLAREIVAVFHGDAAAEEAEKAFVKVFREKRLPGSMPEFVLAGEKSVLDIAVESGMVPSRSEGRRLIRQKAVRLDGRLVGDWDEVVTDPCVLQVGKRRFLAVVSPQGRQEKD